VRYGGNDSIPAAEYFLPLLKTNNAEKFGLSFAYRSSILGDP
jgi:hypothetical protein